MKNSQNGFVIPLLIVIAVLMIGGGVYYFSNKTSAPQINNNEVANTPISEQNGLVQPRGLPSQNSVINNDISAKNSGPFTVSLVNANAVPGSDTLLKSQNGFLITRTATYNGKTYTETYSGFSPRAQIEISGSSYKKVIPVTISTFSRDITFKTPTDIQPGTYKIRVFDYSDETYQTRITSGSIDYKVVAIPMCKEGMQWNGEFCDYKNFTHDANGRLIPDCGAGKWWNGGNCVNN